MLKLYALVACEKVIFDQDGVASLIGLFSRISVSPIPSSQDKHRLEIPKNAVAPKQWAVFSSWDLEPGDEIQEWVFKMQILYPDGAQFGETAEVRMTVVQGKRAQVKVDIPAFPVGQFGHITVRCWIEQNEKTVVAPIEFKLLVELVQGGISGPTMPTISISP